MHEIMHLETLQQKSCMFEIIRNVTTISQIRKKIMIKRWRLDLDIEAQSIQSVEQSWAASLIGGSAE